jgi:hypothetical protein
MLAIGYCFKYQYEDGAQIETVFDEGNRFLRTARKAK